MSLHAVGEIRGRFLDRQPLSLRSPFAMDSLWVRSASATNLPQTYLKLTPYTKKVHIQIGVTWVQERILNEKERTLLAMRKIGSPDNVRGKHYPNIRETR